MRKSACHGEWAGPGKPLGCECGGLWVECGALGFPTKGAEGRGLRVLFGREVRVEFSLLESGQLGLAQEVNWKGVCVPHQKSAKGHVPQWTSVRGDFLTLEVNKRVFPTLEIPEWSI